MKTKCGNVISSESHFRLQSRLVLLLDLDGKLVRGQRKQIKTRIVAPRTHGDLQTGCVFRDRFNSFCSIWRKIN